MFGWLTVAFLLVFFGQTLLAVSGKKSAYEDLHVEGISYEAANPKESVAVVNGVFLKAGDSYQEYKVLNVTHSTVQVEDLRDGSDYLLNITGGVVRKTEEVPSEQPPQNEIVSPPAPSTQMSRGVPGGGTGSPFDRMLGALQTAKDLGVLMDLKQIQTAANVYATENEGKRFTIDDLIVGGQLSDAYAKGQKGAYQFNVTRTSAGVEVSADPIDPASPLKHFLVDDAGQMHEEVGKPATNKSPLRA